MAGQSEESESSWGYSDSAWEKAKNVFPNVDLKGGQTEQINEALKNIEPERKKTMDKFSRTLERKLLG